MIERWRRRRILRALRILTNSPLIQYEAVSMLVSIGNQGVLVISGPTAKLQNLVSE